MRIPRVFWEHTTTRALTMEAASGVRLVPEVHMVGFDEADG